MQSSTLNCFRNEMIRLFKLTKFICNKLFRKVKYNQHKRSTFKNFFIRYFYSKNNTRTCGNILFKDELTRL